MFSENRRPRRRGKPPAAVGAPRPASRSGNHGHGGTTCPSHSPPATGSGRSWRWRSASGAARRRLPCGRGSCWRRPAGWGRARSPASWAARGRWPGGGGTGSPAAVAGWGGAPAEWDEPTLTGKVLDVLGDLDRAGRAGDVHARAAVPDRRVGLRGAAGRVRPAGLALDVAGAGRRGREAGDRAGHLAPARRPLFKSGGRPPAQGAVLAEQPGQGRRPRGVPSGGRRPSAGRTPTPPACTRPARTRSARTRRPGCRPWSGPPRRCR